MKNLGAIRKTARILGAAMYQADGKETTLIDDPDAVFPDAIDPSSSPGWSSVLAAPSALLLT